MHTESRAHAALRNSLWSIIGYIAPILVAAFITPAIVFGLGEASYGIYTFLMSVIAILGLIDLGVSTAVARTITQYHSRQEHEKVKGLIRSANSLGFIIGAVGLVACIALGAGADVLLTGGVTSHAFLYYSLTGLIFLVNSMSFVYVLIPNAVQRFDINTSVGTFLLLSSSLISIVVVKTGGGIAGLLLIQLALSIATTLSYRAFAKKLIPDSAVYAFAWSPTEIKNLYSFGLRSFAANLGNASLSYTSRLVIPFFLGPAALTYYSVPSNVANKIPGITTNLTSVLFPLTTHLSARGETETIKTAYVRSFRLITVLAAAAATAIVIFADPILRYWLNAAFAEQSRIVLILFALTNFALAIFGPLTNFVTGLGKLKAVTHTSFVMAAINAIALVFLLPRYGITGAAWAYLIATLPILYMIYHTERIYLQIELRTHYYLKLIAKTAVSAAATYIVARYALLPFTTDFATLFFTGPACVLSYLALYKVFGFYEEEDWRDITHFLKRLIKRT